MRTIVKQLEEKVTKTISEIRSYQEVTKKIEDSFSNELLLILEKVVGDGKVSDIRTDVSFGRLNINIYLFKGTEKFGHKIDLDIKNGFLADKLDHEFTGCGWFSTSASIQKDPTLLTYLQLVTEINKQALEKSGDIYDSVTRFIKQAEVIKHPSTYKFDDLRKALVFSVALQSVIPSTTLEEFESNPKRHEYAELLDDASSKIVDSKSEELKLKYGNSVAWSAQRKTNGSRQIAPRLTNERIDENIALVKKYVVESVEVFA